MPKYGVTASYVNFSPRVGFVLYPQGDGKTSLRGGFGIFFDSQQVGVENNRLVDISPFSTQVAITRPAGPLFDPCRRITNPSPAPAVPCAKSTFISPVLVVTYDPQHNSRMKAPVTYDYNLILEHQSPRAFSSELRMWAQSRHQTETVELNPAACTHGSTLVTDARRIFKGHGSIGQGTQAVSGIYNSLQLTAQRRVDRQTPLANYTFSKALVEVPSGQGNGIALQIGTV